MSDLWISTKNNPINPAPVQITGGAQYYFSSSPSINDLQVNAVGDLTTISGLTLLQQDINKILLTTLGANTLVPLYGTQLQSYIGNKNVGTNPVTAQIQVQIVNAMNVLNFIRQGSTNLDEIPDTLQYLSITQPEPDTVLIQMNVISAAGNSLVTNVLVSTLNYQG
jgi:hypothetical protein